MGGGSVGTFKTSFFSLASVRTTDYERGGASIGSYNYLGTSYKLTQDSSVAFRYVFFFDSAGFKFNPSTFKEDNIGNTFSQGDPYFSYSRYNVASFGGWDLGGQVRMYLPMAKFTRAAKTAGQFRLETYLDHDVRRYDNISYVVKWDYYFQTQTAYLDDEVPRYNDGTIPDRAIRTTKVMKLEHYLEYDWSLSKYYSVKPKAGFEENWYNGSEAEGQPSRHDTDAKIAIGAEIRPVRNFSFLLSLENDTKLANSKDEVQLFRPENNQWVAITYASF
jgi:hypothetical protein